MRTRTFTLIASILFLLPLQAQKTPNIEKHRASKARLLRQKPQARAEGANASKKWAWLGFERPVGANPIVRPDTTSRFYCPMWKRVAQWENSETFNPAATIINDGIALLYRAEDNIAKGIKRFAQRGKVRLGGLIGNGTR